MRKEHSHGTAAHRLPLPGGWLDLNMSLCKDLGERGSLWLLQDGWGDRGHQLWAWPDLQGTSVRDFTGLGTLASHCRAQGQA